MSNKAKTTPPKPDGKPALVPKLRFPEFREAQWVKKSFEDVAPLQRGFDLPSDLIRPGKIPIVYSNGVQKYHEVGMATAPGLVTGRSGTIGKLHFIENGEYWPHNTSLWVTDFKGNVPRFVYYLYDSIGMGRFSSGSGVPTLNRNDVHAFSSPIPESPAEQQKIADCLSSVDELIAAQARKLGALKTHKKGLMQQLFPREGETQPRLRFPEFQNAGEWDEKPLKEVFSIFQGFAFSSNDSVSGGVRWLKIADVSIQQMNHSAASYLPIEYREKYEKFSVKRGEYVIALTRPILGKQLKMAAVDEVFDGALLNQRVGKLITSQNISFVYFLLQTSKVINDIEKSISGAEPPNLSAQQLEDIKTYIPAKSTEQQRIADCLTSLDDLIAAQTQKLDAVKSHKKGLMQQLFPSPEVVEA